jgi:hypothetical protein
LSEDLEFSSEEAPPSERVSNIALQEQAIIEPISHIPNSVIIKLWGGGQLCFTPNNHTSIFSLIALFAILVTILIVLFIGIWTPPGAVWMDKISSALGFGITGIIGAMVGSAATAKTKKNDEE